MDNNKYKTLLNKAYSDDSLQGVVWDWRVNPLAAYGGAVNEKAPSLRPFVPSQEQIDALQKSAIVDSIMTAKMIAAYSGHLLPEEGQQMSMESAFPEEAKAWYESEHERLYKELLKYFGDITMTYADFMSAKSDDLRHSGYQEKMEIVKECLATVGGEAIARWTIDGVNRTHNPYFGDDWWDIENGVVFEEEISMELSGDTIAEYKQAVEAAKKVESAKKAEAAKKRAESEADAKRKEAEAKKLLLPSGKKRPVLKK